MAYLNFLVTVSLWACFFTTSIAQSCWKNTVCSGPSTSAFPGPWEKNIYAPSSRTVSPTSILSLETGQVISPFPGTSHFQGNGSALVFDFGIEVGGLVTIEYNSTGTGSGSLGLAFTESKNWIGESSDSSNGKFKGPEGALYSKFSTSGSHSYTMPDAVLRGGFRYLTVFLITSSNVKVDIKDIRLAIGFQPTWSNLRAYQGYFHSNDEDLNKIWYSGAYTLQTNSVPVNTGRWVALATANGWANNGTLGPGDTIIVDGAKRDRAVWPGDMGIAVPSSHVSIGDLNSVKNALQVMYDYQNSNTGAFPEAGPPLLQLGSDTYHMWTMIGTYNYVLYSNDTTFLLKNWSKYLLAMKFIYGKVTYASGLLNVTGLRDWARWQTGYNNTQANMILYRTLKTGADLSQWAGDTTKLDSLWNSRAEKLKVAINQYCYDSVYGAYRDNATHTTLYPQDANSMSILFNVTNSPAQAESVSANLLKNWTPIGAVAPELPLNISPFISSFEIQAHLAISQASRALDLIRRCWGWYLNNPNGTGSTVIEGYLVDGTFGYRYNRGYYNDASYISHAHGWSSGPTSALTEFVLGLSVTGRSGETWKLAPQFGDLTNVEGGFVTSLGKFSAKWVKEAAGYNVTWDVPEGTNGVLVLPGTSSSITLDGRVVIVGSNKSLAVTGGQHVVVGS